ncbi:hypothetical protein V8C34DRAFT_278696 [Trichoderma compactum]
MSEKKEISTPTLDDQFEALIAAATADLDAEKERLLREFRKIEAKGGYFDAFHPGFTRLVSRLPSPASNGIASGTFASGSGYSTMWAGFIAAAYQLLVGLPEVYQASPLVRRRMMGEVIAKTLGAALVAGLSAYAVKKLEEFLTKNIPRFLSAICSKTAAESFLFKMVGKGLALPATAGALAAAAVTALTSFYYAATSAWANFNGDAASSDEEWEKMWKALSLDNCLRTAISAAGGYITYLLAPLLGTGYLSVFIPVVLYFLCEWVLELIVASKDNHGGWSRWLASWFMPDQGRKAWVGGYLNDFSNRLPDQLICTISHELVIDPVRSIRTGHVYERKQLYEWLDQRHTDPITLQKAFSIDYIDSPCTAKYAECIAKLLGANKVPITDRL